MSSSYPPPSPSSIQPSSSSQPINKDDADQIAKVATALIEADFVLILAGAGFSADSSLDTYENMPEQYQELCSPLQLVGSNPQRFQQFWMNFAQKYKACEPHDGYKILDRWLSKSTSKEVGSRSSSSSAPSLPKVKECYVYTSNVDGHFRQYASFQGRICEIHGYASEFRCPCKMGLDDMGNTRQGSLWEEWNEQVVSSQCTENCNATLVDVGDENDKADDALLSCAECGLPMRPNVLMFHDTDENIVSHINQQRALYQNWEAQMEDRVVDGNKKLVILEFGCGRNVPAVRIESEEVLQDCLQRIEEMKAYSGRSEEDSEPSSSILLVRINPKDAGIENPDLQNHTISIFDTSLNAIRAIDQAVHKQLIG